MPQVDVGLIGLGTMGAMLAMNIADNGYSVAVHNRTISRIPEFLNETGPLKNKFVGCDDLEQLVQSIAKPRNIILMVPAGEAVDKQIAALRPLLDDDDMIIDAGNANFHETQQRTKTAEEHGYPFLGIGVSGGAEGARFGPSIMGGGTPGSWDRVRTLLEAISAKYEGTPCATWMGHGGAGHFVKTVHNGIEYADMQLIAEVYGIMRDGMGKDAQACGEVFDRWNDGPLQSYLVEISGKVSAAKDPETNAPMLDMILDRASQKGTGRWTVIEGQMLGAPVPVIEAAVAARNLSENRDLRLSGAEAFAAKDRRLPDFAVSLGRLEEGCIIRSTMLNDMASALADNPNRNLMLSSYFKELLAQNIEGLRKTAVAAMSVGQPVPALTSALAYFDTMTSARTTANMLQAQRDFFGAHSFERIDREGAHHGPWLGQHL